MVIRALNDYESNWLDKFEAETVITDFYHTKELKQHKRILDREIKLHSDSFLGKELEGLTILAEEVHVIEDEDLKKRLLGMIERRLKKCSNNELSSKDSELIRIFLAKYKPNENILVASEKLDEIRKRDNLYAETDKQQELYNENNERWNDLYTQAKTNRILDNFEVKDYDKYTMDSIGDLDAEYILIKQVEDNILRRVDFDHIKDTIFVNKKRPYKKRSVQPKVPK